MPRLLRGFFIRYLKSLNDQQGISVTKEPVFILNRLFIRFHS